MYRLLHNIFFLLFFVCFGTNAVAVTVKNLRYNYMPEKVQLVLDLDAPTTFEQFSLPNPPRIVLDIPNAVRTGRAGIAINKGAVRRIRTGFRSKTDLRIVIDLGYVAKANIYTLQSESGRGFRIVIDVYDYAMEPALTLESLDDAQTPYVIFGGGPLHPSAVQKPLFTAQSVPQPVRNKNTTLLFGNRVSEEGIVKKQNTVSSVLPLAGQKDIVIAIDPGHGGKDPGATSTATGLKEKDVVLQIAKKLKRKIDQKKGFKAVLTRDRDIFIPLAQRAAIARKKGADLFVSIHADAVKSNEPSGSSVYILSVKGASSQLAKYLEQTENAVDLRWGVNVKKYNNDVKKALFNIQQEATLESSFILADRTLKELKRVGRVHKDKVERANFVVLRSPEIPSMLVETAFISNPQEARKLASAAYQEELALGIANGIFHYFEEHLPQHMLLGQTKP